MHFAGCLLQRHVFAVRFAVRFATFEERSVERLCCFCGFNRLNRHSRHTQRS